MLTLIALLSGGFFLCDHDARRRHFIALLLMTANMLFGRVSIAIIPHAYIFSSALQCVLAALIIHASQSRSGVALGGLYAVMILGGSLTLDGYLSPDPSIGLAWNYWSVMSVATYAQFVVVTFVLLHKITLRN